MAGHPLASNPLTGCPPGVLPPWQPHRPRGAGWGPLGCPPPRHRPPEQLRQQLLAWAGALAGRGGDLPLHGETPAKSQTHPSPTPRWTSPSLPTPSRVQERTLGPAPSHRGSPRTPRMKTSSWTGTPSSATSSSGLASQVGEGTGPALHPRASWDRGGGCDPPLSFLQVTGSSWRRWWGSCCAS